MARNGRRAEYLRLEEKIFPRAITLGAEKQTNIIEPIRSQARSIRRLHSIRSNAGKMVGRPLTVNAPLAVLFQSLNFSQQR
jgi:hypothetical protein